MGFLGDVFSLDTFLNPLAIATADPTSAIIGNLLGLDSIISGEDWHGSIGDKIDYERNPYQTDPSSYQYDPELYEYLKGQLQRQLSGQDFVASGQMKDALGRAKSGAQAMYTNQGGMGAGTARRLASQQYGQAQQQAAGAAEAIKARQQMAAEEQMRQILAQEHKARMERQKMEQEQFWPEEQRAFTAEKDWAERRKQKEQGALGQVAQIGSQVLGSYLSK